MKFGNSINMIFSSVLVTLVDTTNNYKLQSSLISIKIVLSRT